MLVSSWGWDVVEDLPAETVPWEAAAATVAAATVVAVATVAVKGRSHSRASRAP